MTGLGCLAMKSFIYYLVLIVLAVFNLSIKAQNMAWVPATKLDKLLKLELGIYYAAGLSYELPWCDK